MMNFLYRVLKQDPESREGIITTTSALGIIVNLVVASAKVIFGLIAHSVAIVSEGVNNAGDVLSSALTLVGTKLAGKHPDEKHPFGYGRLEYLTGLIVAVIILLSGYEVIKSSIERIISGETPSMDWVSLIIVAVTAVIKLALGTYTQKMGKKAESSTLEAVGVDCKNDVLVSIATIVSALVFILFGWNIDAYVGIIIGLLIIKAAFEIVSDTVGDLLGKAGDEELANALYKKIRATDGIIGAVDMMLHNYGPDRYSGSVNIEIDHAMSVGEMYQFVHQLQLDIMHEYNVVMVFGIYAVDNDNEEIREVRKTITSFIRAQEFVKSYHAVYLENGTDNLYCDLIVDHKLRDWDAMEEEFLSYMKEKYPSKNVILTLETEFV